MLVVLSVNFFFVHIENLDKIHEELRPGWVARRRRGRGEAGLGVGDFIFCWANWLFLLWSLEPIFRTLCCCLIVCTSSITLSMYLLIHICVVGMYRVPQKELCKSFGLRKFSEILIHLVIYYIFIIFLWYLFWKINNFIWNTLYRQTG